MSLLNERWRNAIPNIGFVGNGDDKFTKLGKQRANDLIDSILIDPDTIVVSGHSPVGGIDIWAEEAAEDLGLQTDIKVPQQHKWDAPYGYKARNLDIARQSSPLHVIVADTYPEEYVGRRFKICYHCKEERPPHVKSGGCWTGKKALEFGNEVHWHIIANY